MNAADPTILPRRVLERQARLHQWLQDVPGLSDRERTLAGFLINRGDKHLDTWKSYTTIAEMGGGVNERSVRRAVAELVERGLLTSTPMKGAKGIRSTNHLRLQAPPELLALRVSEADMRAGADPLEADFAEVGSAAPERPANLAERAPEPRSANLAEPERPANLAAPANGSAMGSVGAANLAEPENPRSARLAEELSSREVVEERQEGSAANLAEREPPPFAGRRRSAPAGLRSAADVFATEVGL